MLILTAFTGTFAHVGRVCEQSLLKYKARNTDAKICVEQIPDAYPCNASWFKVGAIMRHLEHHESVLWIDADTVVIARDSMNPLFDAPKDLVISTDINGINCGVMRWRSTDSAAKALARLQSMQDEYADAQWWEQSALMTFIDDVDHCIAERECINARPGEVTERTLIAHFPALPLEERRMEMMRLLNKTP